MQTESHGNSQIMIKKESEERHYHKGTFTKKKN